MMTDDQILEVVQAHKEGKIQIIDRNLMMEWVEFFEPIVWDFTKYNYRVAPEPRKPREGWIHAFRLHDSREEIQEHYGKLDGPIHVREVID